MSCMKKKITALLDFNDDGELTVDDIQALAPGMIAICSGALLVLRQYWNT